MMFFILYFIEFKYLLKKGGNKKFKNQRRNVLMLRVQIYVIYMIYLLIVIF